jgi:excisionase family DNA binding protein
VGEVLLLTPAQAAEVLQVRESWLRRRAAERRVPCCFVGKHLRFSWADLEVIAADGAHPVRAAGPQHRRRPADGDRLSGSPDRRADHIRACSLGSTERPWCPCPDHCSGRS